MDSAIAAARTLLVPLKVLSVWSDAVTSVAKQPRTAISEPSVLSLEAFGQTVFGYTFREVHRATDVLVGLFY